MIIPISIWPANMLNCFLIRGTNGHVLVDAGIPGSTDKILKVTRQAGLDPADIRLLIVTHSHMDHFGGVGELKKELNLTVLGHELEKPYYERGVANLSTMNPNANWAKLFKQMVKKIETIPFTPDLVMRGDTFDLTDWLEEAQVLLTPGHTPGSLSVVCGREAIIVDMMATGIGLGGVMFQSRVKHPAFHDDLDVLKSSFEKILSFDIDRYYLGHGQPVNRQQVEKYVQCFL